MNKHNLKKGDEATFYDQITKRYISILVVHIDEEEIKFQAIGDITIHTMKANFFDDEKFTRVDE